VSTGFLNQSVFYLSSAARQGGVKFLPCPEKKMDDLYKKRTPLYDRKYKKKDCNSITLEQVLREDKTISMLR